ncbi:hypothetical protein K474DRAFT_1665596 [Panus rudis PR-1116 ss-1]|nr:hypothetical protein K474DRAFT_1665596 [Panus rudis PR-1116 ss-1]
MEEIQCGNPSAPPSQLEPLNPPERIKVSYSKTIIDVLPDELIGDIIDLVVSEYLDSMAFGERMDEEEPFYLWLHSTHVCRRWRQIALQTPKIWRRISITSKDCVLSMLVRSKNANLQVFAKDWGNKQRRKYADLVCHVLCARPHRVESVDLNISPKTYERIRRRLGDTSFTSLRQVRIYSDTDSGSPDIVLANPPLRLRDSPRLEEIDLCSCVFPMRLLPLSNTTTCIKLQQLHERYANLEFEELLDVLQQMPNLKNLILCYSLKPIDNVPSTLTSVALSKLRLISLQGVTMFTTTTLLHCLHFPTTCDVEIQLTETLVRGSEDVFARDIADHFVDTPATTLEIDFSFSPEERISFGARTASNRSLAVTAYSEVDAGGGRSMLTSLLSYLPTSKVRTLILSDRSHSLLDPENPPVWWMPLSHQLPNVETLKLDGDSRRLVSALRAPTPTGYPPLPPTLPPTEPYIHNTPGWLPYRNLRQLDVIMMHVTEDIGMGLHETLEGRRENGLEVLKSVRLYSRYRWPPFEEDSALLSEATFKSLQAVVGMDGSVECNLFGSDLECMLPRDD